jgi:hypothetical protein
VAEHGEDGDTGHEYDWHSRPYPTVKVFERAEEMRERFDRFRERADALVTAMSEEWERTFGYRR